MKNTSSKPSGRGWLCKQMHCFIKLTCASLFLFFYGDPVSAQTKGRSLSSLSAGDTLHGFKVTAVYLNDADEPMGGRFIHEKTGFTLDLLQIESVPQAFIWVNTFPVSDKGEPHTQEHLLITKGNKGHDLNTQEGMSLAGSNAFTAPLHTTYDFYTSAGSEVFYKFFEKYLDALLYPDYTDEEVRREVRNWGVTQNPDKTLRIEEKGSVYNEMTTSMNHPYDIMYDTIGRLLYGNAHPLSFNAGGLPSGIRELQPIEILKYHNENYYLGNMGAITSLPKNLDLESVLEHMDQIMGTLDKSPQHNQKAKKLPPGRPASEGEIALVGFPSVNAQEPGSILFAFRAPLNLDAADDVILSNFLTVFAGDPTTNLYKIFVESKTRQKDFDAQAVYGNVAAHEGDAIFIGLDGIKAENLTKEKGILVRKRIQDELRNIAEYKDHSPELIEFNKRFENSLTSSKRTFSKFVNSPPRFGFRDTYDEWYNQLEELNKIKSFRKSVVLKQQFQQIEKELSGGTNIWKTYLEKWNLLTGSPYVIIGKANPELIAKSEAARKQRAGEEVARLRKVYHLSEDQETILHYKQVYDSNSTVLEKLEQAHIAKFIDNPPLTLDDELNFRQELLPGNIPMVASVFNNMTSATTGIAINLNGVPEDKLLYLAILPELLTQTGIIKDGNPVSFEDMSQMIQQQILSLQAYYTINPSTKRVELNVVAAGNNAAEAERSVEWINDILKQPNWRKENLPHLQDLVEQQLSSIRKRMQGAEEEWVNDPGRSYRLQDHPLILATSSFLTREQNIFRLKWMLKDEGEATDSAAISHFLATLANAETNREQLKKMLSVINSDEAVSSDSAGINKQYAESFNPLSPAAKLLARDAGRDLEQMLNEIPDGSLTADWKYLCHRIQKDLTHTPEKTLNELNALRESLLKNDHTRMYMIGSENTEQKLASGIQQLVSTFNKQPSVKKNYSTAEMINERVKARINTSETPVFAGLVNPNSPTGVFINSASLVSYGDTSRGQLLMLLAASLYGGAGKQSVYTKTTGAGLSYSTGVGSSLETGRFNYYAERTPELPQTLRFVIDEIKRSPVDTALTDYVIANTIGFVYTALDYETRGEIMAEDLAAGLTPEVVKRFRMSILNLRKEPDLIHEIYKYKDAAYEKILPGYGALSKDVAGGCFFVIGAEKQMMLYEAYLKSVNGPETKLFRLYPRDFWMVQNE